MNIHSYGCFHYKVAVDSHSFVLAGCRNKIVVDAYSDLLLYPLVPSITQIIISIWVGPLSTTLEAALTLPVMIYIGVVVLTIVPYQGETI